MPINHIHKSDDRTLLERIQVADSLAFEELLNKKGAWLFNLANNILHDKMLAQDAVSETYLALIKKCNSIRNPHALNAWLKTTVTRKALTFRNAKQVFIPCSSEKLEHYINSSTDTNLDMVEIEHIRDCLAALSENEYTVLMFHYYGFSVRQISKLIDIKQSQIRTLLKKSKTNFQNLYKS